MEVAGLHPTSWPTSTPWGRRVPVDTGQGTGSPTRPPKDFGNDPDEATSEYDTGD